MDHVTAAANPEQNIISIRRLCLLLGASKLFGESWRLSSAKVEGGFAGWRSEWSSGETFPEKRFQSAPRGTIHFGADQVQMFHLPATHRRTFIRRRETKTRPRPTIYFSRPRVRLPRPSVAIIQTSSSYVFHVQTCTQLVVAHVRPVGSRGAHWKKIRPSTQEK